MTIFESGDDLRSAIEKSEHDAATLPDWAQRFVESFDVTLLEGHAHEISAADRDLAERIFDSKRAAFIGGEWINSKPKMEEDYPADSLEKYNARVRDVMLDAYRTYHYNGFERGGGMPFDDDAEAVAIAQIMNADDSGSSPSGATADTDGPMSLAALRVRRGHVLSHALAEYQSFEAETHDQYEAVVERAIADLLHFATTLCGCDPTHVEAQARVRWFEEADKGDLARLGLIESGPEGPAQDPSSSK